MPNRSSDPVVFALFVGLIAATPAVGQTAGQGAPLGSTRQAIAARVPVDSLVELASPRTPGALDDARRAAARRERQARNRRSRAERARDNARAAREVEVEEIERLERAMDIADELDQTARKSRLERDRELRERYRDLIRKRIEAHEIEMELAEREERHARALLDRIDVEQRLADDFRQWRLLHGEGAIWSDAAERRKETERRIVDGLRDYFAAQREEARQSERVEVSRRKLVEKQLEFIEQRRSLFED